MKFAFVDVETTGGKPTEDRIIDIGIVLVDNFQVVHEWQSLVNPEVPINPFITSITGISEIHICNAPTFKTIHETIEELLADRIFVAHNVRFDYSFVKHEFSRLNKRFQAPQLCTVKLSHKLYPQHKRHNLDEIITRFNISIEQRHRALPDAKTLYYFLNSCIQEKTEAIVTDYIQKLIHHPSLPIYIPEEQIAKLPKSPGVYIFYDASASPLYVGKSKNIRERVLSHFYDDTNSDQELHTKNQITHIESINCAGELEALVLESRLVKELQPISNKLLRKCDQYWVALLEPNDSGYLNLRIQKQANLSYIDRLKIAAVSKSKRSLNHHIKELVEMYQLCPKLCGQETGKGACFSYHLGTCNGPCTESELVDSYNLRVKQAFTNPPIPTWPYPEPIIVHEYNADLELNAYHLINNWCFLSSVKTIEDISTVTLDSSYEVSLDELSIIRKFLYKPTSKVIPFSRLTMS